MSDNTTNIHANTNNVSQASQASRLSQPSQTGKPDSSITVERPSPREPKPNQAPQKQQVEQPRFGCFHCNESFSSDIERATHRGQEHPGKLDYPTPEDFDSRLKPNR